MRRKVIALRLLKLAKELLAADGSEVEEAEEVEPQGSTPIKERRKQATHSPAAQDVVQSLKPVRKAIVELRGFLRESDAKAADRAYLDLIDIVKELEKEAKKF